MVRVKQWPLWVRYVIAVGSGVAIVVALVVVVHEHQGQSEGLPASPSKAQLVQEVQQDTTLVKQEQAPKVARVTGMSGAKAASHAITLWMTTQTSKGFINGPLDSQATCVARSGRAGRAAFDCTIDAGPTGSRLEYPFDAVVQGSMVSATVTYCQVITPPSSAVTEPAVSARCT